MESLTAVLLFAASTLFVLAGIASLATALCNSRERSEQNTLANLFAMQSKQLMSFHKAGIMLANSEAQLCQAEADNKRAEADRLQAQANLVNAQQRETEANTDVDAIPKPTAPPKFGSQGRHRVGETAFSEEANIGRTR